MRFRFKHRVLKLSAERLASTLLGCIHRRFFQIYVLSFPSPDPLYVNIEYNDEFLNVFAFPDAPDDYCFLKS